MRKPSEGEEAKYEAAELAAPRWRKVGEGRKDQECLRCGGPTASLLCDDCIADAGRFRERMKEDLKGGG